MKENEPTNRELKLMLDNLAEKSDLRHQDYKLTHAEMKLAHEKMMLTLDQILAQATKTNGRVNRLEWWRGAIIWGFSILLMFVVPLVVNALK